MNSLYELTREEWWDVMREQVPGLTREEFDEAWDDFIARKLEQAVNGTMH